MRVTDRRRHALSMPAWVLPADRSRRTESALRMELVRKGIHLMVVFIPTMAKIDRTRTISLLIAGILVYAMFERLRHSGYHIPIVSRLTELAQRDREQGKFVMGPITLGMGALLSLLIFPPVHAAIAIYALGFGDGLSSLVGRFAGRIKLPLTRGKSLEGSCTCFAAVFMSTSAIRVGLPEAAMIAAFATVIEAIPAGDMDNVFLPLATGTMATILAFPIPI